MVKQESHHRRDHFHRVPLKYVKRTALLLSASNLMRNVVEVEKSGVEALTPLTIGNENETLKNFFV